MSDGSPDAPPMAATLNDAGLAAAWAVVTARHGPEYRVPMMELLYAYLDAAGVTPSEPIAPDTTPSDADDLLTFLDDTFSGGHEIRFCATHEPVNDRGRTEERDGATIVWVDEPLPINEFGDTERRHECLSDALRAWYRRDGVAPSEGIDAAILAGAWTPMAASGHVPPSAPDTTTWQLGTIGNASVAEPSAPDTKADDERMRYALDVARAQCESICEDGRSSFAVHCANIVLAAIRRVPLSSAVVGKEDTRTRRVEWWVRDRVGSWLGPHASRADAQRQALYYDAHQDSQKMGPHRVVQADR